MNHVTLPHGNMQPAQTNHNLLLLLLFVINAMQCIYNYAPETNHVPTVYHVAAILLLQYMAHVTLSPTINPLHCAPVHSAVCAVLNVAVLFSSWTS